MSDNLENTKEPVIVEEPTMESESSTSAGAKPSSIPPYVIEKPTADSAPVIITLGMAGSGKTSFVSRLASYLHEQKNPPYLINLDPATSRVPFPANIDIRDTVKYKEVMKQFNLGPNGAIMTSLNLICTQFDKIMDILKERSKMVNHIVIDTPGQIEAFTWSASGTIITDSLASSHPTMIAYVIDSARAVNPTTFMSNMLYACSILYRTKLPFFIVFNKSDVVKPTFALKWMKDFESFQDSLEDTQSTYMTDLTRSLSLVLDSFYENINAVCVSSKTGEGMDKVLEVIQKCKSEYFESYRPMYDERMKEELIKREGAIKQDAEIKEKNVLGNKIDIDSADLIESLKSKVHLGGVDEENKEDSHNFTSVP
uniref:GPN-loop GTPase n=1 Tax=Rhabditophanes sp. KR3021 TaxID=114890 RepID=A0AC35TYC8_9BILA